MDVQDPQTFAQVLEQLRQLRGLSPAELARALDVYEADISRWRRGLGISIKNVRKVADFFGVERSRLERLAGYDTQETSPDPDHPRVPLSVQQHSLQVNYERWMTVMGPRMGDQAAHDAYWDPLVRNAAQAVSTAEAVIDAVANPLESTAVSEAESGAVSDRVSGPQRPTNTPPDDPTGPLGICKTPPIVRLRELAIAN